MTKIELVGEQVAYVWAGQSFLLDAAKVIFWENESALVISDVHLGKAGHFRKHGIPVPQSIHFRDFSKMDALIKKYNPKKIIFLGDLFHSESNNEWNDLISWSEHKTGIEMILVEGNHDRLTSKFYENTKFVLAHTYKLEQLVLSHEPIETKSFNLFGHIHPAMGIQSSPRQSQTYPCFYFGEKTAIMPAFGAFTGTYRITPEKGCQVFCIDENQLIRIIV